MSRAIPAPGGEPDWTAIERTYGLTSREMHLLRLLWSSGKGNRELAEQLGISLHTVKSHVRSIFLKVGVSTRAQLFRKIRV